MPSGGDVIGYNQRQFVDDSPPPNLITLEFIDENTGWLAGRIGLFKTVDAGITWQQVGPRISVLANSPESPIALTMLTHILYLDFATESTGWAARYDGLIKTTDAGKTWVLVDYPIRFYQFSFTDEKNGWGFAHDLFIYRSSDGGRTWTRQVQGGPVLAVSKNECWAISNDLVLHTVDAGASWSTSRVISSTRLSGQPVVLGKHVWVKTTREVFSSNDQGMTWHMILTLSKNDHDINSIAFADELNGWAAGPKGAILHTRDGGKSWQKQQASVGRDLRRIAIINKDVVWILGDDTLLRTLDSGDHWTLQEIPVPKL